MFKDKDVFLYHCTKTLDHLDIEIEDLSMLVPCENNEKPVIEKLIMPRKRLIGKIQDVIDRVIDGEIGACEEIEDILTKYTEYKPIEVDSETSIIVDKKALEIIKEGYEQLMRCLK